MLIDRWRYGKNTTHKRLFETATPAFSAYTLAGVTTYAISIHVETGEDYHGRYDRAPSRVRHTIEVHLTSDELDKLIELRERQRLREREKSPAPAGNDIHYCEHCSSAVHCNAGVSAAPEQLARHGIGQCSERCGNCFKVAPGQLRGACPNCGVELVQGAL
jgi:hypothetical protein